MSRHGDIPPVPGETLLTDAGEGDWHAAVMAQIAARNRGQLISTPGAQPIDLPGVVGLLGAQCFIYVSDLQVSPQELVPRLRDAAPASFVLLAGAVPETLDRALEADEWALRRHLEMMLLVMHSAPDLEGRTAASGVAIEPIDATNLADAQALSDVTFGFQSDLSRLVDTPLAGGQLTRDDRGRVIAMGAWSKARRGARIINIATDPAHRGRGLGGLMTIHAVLSAQRAGAEFAYLEATADGAGVYRRVGFRTLDTWRVFHRPQLIAARADAERRPLRPTGPARGPRGDHRDARGRPTGGSCPG